MLPANRQWKRKGNVRETDKRKHIAEAGDEAKWLQASSNCASQSGSEQTKKSRVSERAALAQCLCNVQYCAVKARRGRRPEPSLGDAGWASNCSSRTTRRGPPSSKSSAPCAMRCIAVVFFFRFSALPSPVPLFCSCAHEAEPSLPGTGSQVGVAVSRHWRRQPSAHEPFEGEREGRPSTPSVSNCPSRTVLVAARLQKEQRAREHRKVEGLARQTSIAQHVSPQ